MKKKNEVPKAIQILIQALKEDPSYRECWAVNLSMCFYTEHSRHPQKRTSDKVTIEVANKAADHFIELLIKDTVNSLNLLIMEGPK